MAKALFNVGIAEWSESRYVAAEAAFREATTILADSLGTDSTEAAQAANNLASLLLEMGKLDEAEALYRRALAVYEEVLPADHPVLANVLDNLGVVLTGRGDFAAAEALHRRALDIRRRDLGEEHQDTAPRSTISPSRSSGKGDLPRPSRSCARPSPSGGSRWGTIRRSRTFASASRGRCG